jgi:septum formation protein
MNSLKKLILASSSPRRKQLLEENGFKVEVIPSKVEEIIQSEWSLEEVAVKLADLKAMDIYEKLGNPASTIVIGADTIVVWNDQILGKPRDASEAFVMLKNLSGTAHIVYTGVSFRGGMDIQILEKTTVHFAPITDEQINYYISHYNPMDKAGAYGIQEWLGVCFVEKIEGCYTNVMGLPMRRVFGVLEKYLDFNNINEHTT